MQCQLLFSTCNTKIDCLSHGHFMIAVVYNNIEQTSHQKVLVNMIWLITDNSNTQMFVQNLFDLLCSKQKATLTSKAI